MDKTILKPFSIFSNLDKNAVILMDDEGRKEIPQLWRNIWNGASIRACTNNSCELICCYANQNEMKIPTLICGETTNLHAEAKKCFTNSNFCDYCSDDKNHLTRCLECVGKLPEIQGHMMDCIVVLGGFSGRLDHILGDLNALFSAQVHITLPIYAIDGNNLITILTHEGGKFEILVDSHMTTRKCGLVPLKHPHVTVHGLKWDLDNEEMHFGGTISTSNEIMGDKVEINTTGPVVFNMELANAVLEVYTDGSVKKTGQIGIGIFFGKEHPLNLCRKIELRKTKNDHKSYFAELQAVIAAVERVRTWKYYDGRTIKLYTDCNQIIESVETMQDPMFPKDFEILKDEVEKLKNAKFSLFQNNETPVDNMRIQFIRIDGQTPGIIVAHKLARYAIGLEKTFPDEASISGDKCQVDKAEAVSLDKIRTPKLKMPVQNEEFIDKEMKNKIWKLETKVNKSNELREAHLKELVNLQMKNAKLKKEIAKLNRVIGMFSQFFADGSINFNPKNEETHEVGSKEKKL